eukprot:1601900-Prymnesium_polylepis.1
MASAVEAWASGKDLPAMLCSLRPFAGVLGEAVPVFAEHDVGPKGVRLAYRRACLQLHPDRHVGSSPRVQTMAEELFKVLSAAYVDWTSTTVCSAAMSC